MQPTRGDVHVNRPLTNMSIAYIQSASDFIADKVFPQIPVKHQADSYYTYEKKAWFQTQARERASGTESAGSGFNVNADNTYNAKPKAVHKDVADQDRANQDEPLDLDRDATLFVSQQMMLKREKDFASKYMTAGVWEGYSGGDFTPSTKWDTTNGDPMSDIDDLKMEMKSQTGFEPNVLVVTADVHKKIKNLPKVLDRIKYTQTGIVTEQLLSSLFGLKYLILQAVEDSAAEGQEAQMDFLLRQKALLCYANPNPSIMQPSAGYTFSWSGLFGAGAFGTRIKRFRMEHLSSDRVEGEMAYDQKLVGADLGVFLTDLLT